MCGIIGFTGEAEATPILLDGLAALEYRGYDSAGIAWQSEEGIDVCKTCGRLSVLTEKLKTREGAARATCGIGHTRWATHGAPSDRNAHPHATERVALVHNGIIENYAEIAAFLRARGYTFESETDTETAVKLIDWFYRETGEPETAVFRAVSMLRGSFAFSLMFADRKGEIFAIRRDNPLIVAATGKGGIVASDVTAILAHGRAYYRPAENVLAVVRADGVSFTDAAGAPVGASAERVDWNVEEARKGGYPHFMLKEIFEEPEAIKRTVVPRLVNGLPHFGIPVLDTEAICRYRAVHIVACGTAMHAGMVGAALIERYARIPVRVEIASEFRYRDPVLSPDDLVLLLSQSGETADTLAALRHAKAAEVGTLAIVNVIGSSVAREADAVLYTFAGPEIAVASTKAYSVQCALLFLLALRLGLAHGKLTEDEVKAAAAALAAKVPEAVAETLRKSEEIRTVSGDIRTAEHLFYIGRGIDYALSVEGSLKLKEISYLHSEAYAAGELKHGTISLVTDGTPVVALTTVPSLAEKTVSGIREVAARGARVLSIVTGEIAARSDPPAAWRIVLPEIGEPFSLFPAATALQLLAYHTAAGKGLDVDKPRNLAKSVTVE